MAHRRSTVIVLLFDSWFHDMAQLLNPVPPSADALKAFLDRHEYLLGLERAEEEEQTRLLNTNCPPKLLEQRGLALGGLGVVSIATGLGGKTSVGGGPCDPRSS